MSMTTNTSAPFALSWTGRAPLAFAPTCTRIVIA